MKILHISRNDISGGGASCVATELTKYMIKAGCDATHYNNSLLAEHPLYGSQKSIISYLKHKEGKSGYRDYAPIELLSSVIRNIPQQFDIIHLHDMSTVMSAKTISYLASRIPIVWTLHDCSPFTAGCIYPGSCLQYQNTCTHCPKLREWPLQTKNNHVSKLHTSRKKLQNYNITFTAPSQWMTEKFNQIPWTTKIALHISNAVDIDIYYPRNRQFLLQKYNVPDDGRPIFLFSAAYLEDSRKGGDSVAQALRAISDTNPILCLVGRYSDQVSTLFKGINILHFGFIKDNFIRAEIMGLCDASFILSNEENCPLTLLESLAVGTPVIAFPNGGIKELVHDGYNGIICSKENITQIFALYSKNILNILKLMRENCSKYIMENHTYQIIGNKFLNLYSQLLENK